MEHPRLTLFLILALIVLVWWLVSRLITAVLEDIVDVIHPWRRLLDQEEMRFDVEVEIEERSQTSERDKGNH